MPPLASSKSQPLNGTVCVPGDKSISHRALIMGALAVGETVIEGLLEGEDVLHTGAALEALGARIERPGEKGNGATWRVLGRGVGGLSEAETTIDMGNSGTGARLLMGVAAAHPITTVFAGDASLSARPMARVVDPLVQIGAKITARSGCRLPVSISGAKDPLPITWRPSVPSAQVKSAILLAGLNAPGTTSVIEPAPTRDHTENLLDYFGAKVATETLPDGTNRISVEGYPELEARKVTVPGDVSSAAFPLVGALVSEGSNIVIQNVGINPLRVGLIDTLLEMGAQIRYENKRTEAGEPVADIFVSAGPMRGVDVPAARAPSMIDEYPVLAVAAAVANGKTIMRGLSELRVKESDRLSAIAEGLAACGVRVEADSDTLTVHGTGGRPPPGGGQILTHMDHRIAMSFLVLGMVSKDPVQIDNSSMIKTSFPDFANLMNSLGTHIQAAPE